MARTATPEDVQTGTEAYEHVVDAWQRVGLGMVEAEFNEPYLTVSRGGADWTLFLPVTDDEPVLVPHDAVNGDVTTKHIPEEHRAEGKATKEDYGKLNRAFGNASGGMYPLDDGFSISFMDDGEKLALIVSHTDGSLTVRED